MMVFLFGFASWMVYLGFDGLVMNDVLPVQYLGYFLLAYGFAGLFGWNIWAGGPLDPRNDPPSISDYTDELKKRLARDTERDPEP
ncbi:MAG: hypothetical protein ACKO23_00875 [Gemmataceae bacterium]